MRSRTETVRPKNRSYAFHVIGGQRQGFRDVYHGLLKMNWWQVLGLIVFTYLLVNVLFAAGYLATGGIVNARPHSFRDAFFFSAQTLGTIGYGAMYPATDRANELVVVESIVGLLFTALATGIVFVRFSQTRARVLFTRNAAIAPMDGVPTLMIRLGNERNNTIYDARMRVTLSMKKTTREGHSFYMSEDLALVREHATNLNRSWTLLHRITEKSPLWGATPDSLEAAEAELLVSLSGTDDTSLQPVHGRHLYEHFSIRWGHRLVDVLSENAQGDVVLDLRKFHDLEPTQALPEFPYPRPS